MIQRQVLGQESQKLVFDTEMSSCIFGGSQCGQFEFWNARETMLHGIGCMEAVGVWNFHYCVRCSLFSWISFLLDVSVADSMQRLEKWEC